MALQWSWRELEKLATWLRPEIEGAFVEKIFVPERTEHPDGYLRAEWALRLSHRDRGSVFVFGLRPQEVYLDLINDQKVRAAVGASRSGFDLVLQKTLEGGRLERLESLPGDRRLLVWFRVEDVRYGLLLQMIPAMPEAIFFREEGLSDWRAIARTRVKESLDDFSRASLERAPTTNPPSAAGERVRADVFESLKTYTAFVRDDLRRSFLRLKVQTELKRKGVELKKLEQNLRTAETQGSKAGAEADYGKYGALLQSELYRFKKSAQGAGEPWLSPLVLQDWENEVTLEVPIDEAIEPAAQLEKFYWLEKRKKRRLEESASRIETFRARVDGRAAEIAQLRKLALGLERATSDVDAIAREIRGLVATPSADALPGLKDREREKFLDWGGRTYRSKEGLAILVGRTKAENLDLTLKLARGNDLWFHLKGRPGSHVVIPLRDRKSASLETMLDAAMLCIFYSGGKDWGKAEVDYTYRKHVKRIKDSDEVAYVQNRTLSVTIDRNRLQQLLDQGQV